MNVYTNGREEGHRDLFIFQRVNLICVSDQILDFLVQDHDSSVYVFYCH